jgi:hypothetical protein
MSMYGCMSASRLTTLLAVLLATVGLSVLPSGALAQDDPVDDDGVVLVDDGLDEGIDEVLDDDMWCDDDFSGVDEDETELRQLIDDSEFIDEDDPDFLGPDDEDDGLVDEGEASDDELLDDCLGAGDEDLAEDGASAAVTTDTTRLVKKGVLTARLYVPGKAVLDSSLTKSGAHVAKRGRALGSAHKRTAKAGMVTLRIKLTPKGRKVVRKATRKLRLVLTTHIALAGGKQLTRTTRIRV